MVDDDSASCYRPSRYSLLGPKSLTWLFATQEWKKESYGIGYQVRGPADGFHQSAIFFPGPQWPASAFSPSLSSPNDQDSVNSKERCRTRVEFPSRQLLQVMLTNAPSTGILKSTTGHENRRKWSSMTTVIRICLDCYSGCTKTLGNKTWTCRPGTSKSHFPQSSVSIAVQSGNPHQLQYILFILVLVTVVISVCQWIQVPSNPEIPRRPSWWGLGSALGPWAQCIREIVV